MYFPARIWTWTASLICVRRFGTVTSQSTVTMESQHLRIVGQCRYASLLLLLPWLVVFNAWYELVHTRVVCAKDLSWEWNLNVYSTAWYRICHSWALLTINCCCRYNNTCLKYEWMCFCCCFCCCVILLTGLFSDCFFCGRSEYD